MSSTFYLIFQTQKFKKPARKKTLEDEQLQIISECSNELVSLSLRHEKEEKQRREQRLNAEKKHVQNQQELTKQRNLNQTIADKKVNTDEINLFIQNIKQTINTLV